ncbi:uncharacterized protein BT62DRAFT_101548 [Guyanagaster necrorhizus]|uniref:Uncharacterized protein n=1 Tax=Guyanagaster necrorhizus TaxID=856835 RepID=A0A9P7VUQ5_9AGAR|nr:uncharacterized protein BT62DRAFT_101548 [Guyanagaster necrorhizus MCA 3950]KAG7447070.1 hypothetical protein BT62DRAFT_101548 [Guyanagaster necrorhizus MCA 3950]
MFICAAPTCRKASLLFQVARSVTAGMTNACFIISAHVVYRDTRRREAVEEAQISSLRSPWIIVDPAYDRLTAVYLPC